MKKKIFGITLAVALVVLSIAGTSLAYFSDTETATNTFTSGEGIKIKLTYAETDVDDDANPGSAINISEKAYPGQKFEKSAKITNIGTDNENTAYVGAIITISNTKDISGIINSSNISSFFPDLTKEGYTVKVTGSTNICTVYVIKNEALGKGASAAIFNEIAIPAAWGNSEMATFSGTKIEVTAYAVQTVGFDNATDALTKAFKPAWEGFASTNP